MAVGYNNKLRHYDNLTIVQSSHTTVTHSIDAAIREPFEKRCHSHLYYLLQQTNAGAPAFVKYCNHRWNQRRSKSYALQNFVAIRRFIVYSWWRKAQ
jgi:hypothetical protein